MLVATFLKHSIGCLSVTLSQAANVASIRLEVYFKLEVADNESG